MKLNGSAIVALNRAVAVARVHGSQAGLAALDAVPARSSLETYHLYHAVRGTFLSELGRNTEAILHFRKAETLATLPSERDFMSRRIRECERAGQK